MDQTNRKCIQCSEEKSLEEFFIYKKTGKHYSWCKDCVRKSADRSQDNHVSKSKNFRERWGAHAV